MNLLIEAVGWAAMICILTGYFLITGEKVTSRSPLYQWLNLVGAILFIIYLIIKEAWPSVAMNVIWAAISIVALYSIFSMKKGSGNVDDSD